MKIRFTLVTIALIYATNSKAQVSYYVSPSGSNSNPGTITKPWKTFQKACDAATPGSTVYMRSGTYAKAVLNVNGTAGNFITYTNYPGEVAIIDGGNAKRTLFYAKNKNYIRLQGLEFRNAVGNYSIGVEFDGKCTNIEIVNNKIHDIHFNANPLASVNSNKNTNPLIIYGTDSLIAASNILITGNEIYNCRTGFSEACTVNGNVDGWEISSNVIHDITNIGIDAVGGYKVSKNPALDVARNGVIRGNTVYNCKSPYASAAGIYVDGGDSILIEQNISFNNQYGFEIGCEEKNAQSEGVIMRNNIAYNNDEAGLAIGGYNYPNTGKVINCSVHNNTFYNNDVTNKGQGEVTMSRLESSTLFNNVFHGGAKRLLFTSTIGNTYSNNINYNNWFTDNTDTTKYLFKINGSNFKTFAAYTASALGWDANAVYGNPLFVSSTDFHLSTGSSAYQAGDPTFVAAPAETDYDFNPRIFNGRVDAGAYESQVPLRKVINEHALLHQVYPNPCNEWLNIKQTESYTMVKIFDAKGNLVLTSLYTDVLDVAGLVSGCYFLELSNPATASFGRCTFIKK
jgi:hypothetical protein